MKTLNLALGLIGLLISAVPLLAADQSKGEVAIYYQQREFKDRLEKIAAKIKEAGIPVTLEYSPMHQTKEWANSIRYFHPLDIGFAAHVQGLANDAGLLKWGGLGLLDLSKEFSTAKVKQGRIEFWVCDADKNDKLPPAPYEAKFKPIPTPTFEPARGYFDFSKNDATDNVTGANLSVVIERDRRLEGKKDLAGPEVNEGGIDTGDRQPEYFNAKLVLRDASGKELDSKLLDEPLATIDVSELEGGKPVFLLTIDYSIGWGSYNGPVASLLTVTGGKLSFIEFKDAKSGTREPFRMMDSLKNASKILDSKNILKVSCHPDFDNPKNTADNLEFSIDYAHYSWENGIWVCRSKTVSGFWENEGDFPDRNLFP
jgi:hypothetical protein